MNRMKIVTGLDIGSSKVSAVSAAIDKSGNFEILSQVTEPSSGVSRGLFADLGKATVSVTAVLSKISRKISAKPGDIYVSISAPSIKGAASRGMIPISLRGREVTKMDMAKCVNAASTIHLPFDRDIIHRIVHNFSVDDNLPVSNPLGLYASRLFCEAYIITAESNLIQNIHKCVSSAGYDVKEVVFTAIADGVSLLSEDDRKDGTILIDMGDSMTEAGIFEKGTLRDFEIIPLGARDMADSPAASAVLGETLAKISEKMNSYRLSGGNIGSAVLTGGLTFADGIIELAESKLACPVRMGAAKDIKGDISSIDSVRLATAIGLVRYAHGKYMADIREHGNPARTLWSKVVDLFNNYF